MLRTLSRYSGSYLEIQISGIGVIADIHYDPDTAYTEQIKQINKLIDADLGEDIPLDLILFFLPFAPVGSGYLISGINERIDDELICMIYRLNVDLLDNCDLISLMKSLYEIVNNLSPDKSKKSDHEIKYMKDVIRTYITCEYLTIVTNKSKQLKNNDEHITNNDEYITPKITKSNIVKLMIENGDKKFINHQFLQKQCPVNIID